MVYRLRCNDARQRTWTDQPPLLQATWGPVPAKAPPSVSDVGAWANQVPLLTAGYIGPDISHLREM
eukprot:4010175-Alexandrium_andersonii.AAC.1